MVRLVGTLTDVTEFKTAEERLLHDAVHDNLTGLPNRELFLDRLEAVLGFAKADTAIKPTVMVIDLDRFKQVNDSVGMALANSILLTLSRRLGRLSSRTIRSRASPAISSVSSFCRSAIRRASPRLPKPSAARCARRSPSTIAKSS